MSLRPLAPRAPSPMPWRLAAFAFAAILLAAQLGLPLRQQGMAVFWPAAGVFAGLLTICSGASRLGVALGGIAALGLSNALLGRSPEVSLTFMIGNVVQALLVATILRRVFGTPPRLDRLACIAAAMVLPPIVVALVGAAVTTALQAVGHAGGDWMPVWRMWFGSHAIGLVTLAPPFIAFAAESRAGLMRRLARTNTLAMLAAFAIAAHLLLGSTPSGSDLALIMLFALLYPALLGIAATSSPFVTTLALMALAFSVTWHQTRDGSVFGSDVRTAQLFLAVAATWTISLIAVFEQQRRTLREARGSEARMQQALEIGRSYNFEWTPADDRMVRNDPRGILAEVVRESGTAFFERIVPEDRDKLTAALHGLRPDAPSYEVAFRARRSDGSVVWLEERSQGEFDARGDLTVLRGLVTDVSTGVLARQALEEADRAKDRFIATLGHELRNPLAPIRNAVHVLRRKAPPDAVLNWCEDVIERQVGNMARLLDELLDVSRMSSGKIRLQRQPVPLAAVVTQATEAARPAIDAGGHRLEIELPHHPVTLDADPMRLAQVLTNLLANAAKYTEHAGTIRLHAAIEPQAPLPLSISVRDDGIGIAAEDLPRIFDMFSQAREAVGRSQGGLGIGLWLVQHIVTLHGGTVAARSDGPGCGSELVVRLPLLSSAAPCRDAAPRAGNRSPLPDRPA